MRKISLFCALALSLALLPGCMPGIVITSPQNEQLQREFQEDWEESMEDIKSDWEDALNEFQDAWGQDEDGVEKDHYWKILNEEDQEVGTVTDEEQVKAIDGILSDDGQWGRRMAEDPGDPACSYVYCQQETLKAGQNPEDREYKELVRFAVSASEDVITMKILEELPALLNVDLVKVDLGTFLTFTIDVPAETAEALRDPDRFLG